MHLYEKEQERLRSMLDIASSELGDPNSDYSDVEDELLINNSAAEDSDSEGSDSLIHFDEGGLNEHELAIPGPSHHDTPMNLSLTADSNIINMSRNQRIIINPTYTGRNKPVPTIWSSTPQPKPGRTRKHNLVTQLPGPKREAQNAQSEIECWSLFFSEIIIDKLVQYTNIKIRQIQGNYARARETDKFEIKAVIGLLYLAGVTTSARLNPCDLWRKDGLGVELFNLTIGVNRFKFLMQNMRFDDVASEDRKQRKEQDKFYCFREFFEDFSRRCQENYSHSAYVTIDEMLPNFRGKCSFRVYMPKKPGKFGIKVWAVTDSKTFYTSKLEVFIPNQNRGPFCVSTSTRDVVNRMVSHIEGTGRNITCDNYFTSIPIAQDLLKKQLTLVGTIWKNKSEIPFELITEDKGNKRSVNSSMFAFTMNETLVSYKATDKKFVVLLSTFHDEDEIDEESGDAYKPSIITFYDKNKCGVDVSDGMQKEYSVARISNRWPLSMVFYELNVGGINAYVIWKANNRNQQTFKKDFLEKLGRQLILEHVERRAAANYPIARSVKDRLIHIFKLMPARPEPQSVPVQRGHYNICGICPRRKNRKTTVTCDNCDIPICKEHTGAACFRCTDRDREQVEADVDSED